MTGWSDLDVTQLNKARLNAVNSVPYRFFQGGVVVWKANFDVSRPY